MTDVQKINLFCILEDLQDTLLTEITPDLSQALKMWANKSRKVSKRFIKEIDTILPLKSAENFGMDSDNIMEILENYMR